jgi:hypothetical protein
MTAKERVEAITIGMHAVIQANDHRHPKIVYALEDAYLDGVAQAARILGDEDLEVAAEALAHRREMMR